MGVVTVFLDRVENLIDSDRLGKSDPYVKFQLEQDNCVFDKNFGKKESTHKRNDCSPVYGETFEWEVPSLNNMVIWIRVMDDDVGRDEEIGAGKIKLEHAGLTASPKELEIVVDKKSPEGSICNPCMLLCACCSSLCKKSATIHLKISYTE